MKRKERTKEDSTKKIRATGIRKSRISLQRLHDIVFWGEMEENRETQNEVKKKKRKNQTKMYKKV